MASDGEVAVGGRTDCAEKSRLLRGHEIPVQGYSKSTIKKDGLILVVVAFTACPGCNHDPGSFQGHNLGESLAQFCAIEHPKTEIPPGVPYTGTIHCFDEENLGDQCKGPRKDFDNAHFTFIDDKLARIETIGLGGIIGNSRQNWNWNLYLSGLRKQYGKPDKMTDTEGVWTHGSYVVHAYLTVGPLAFTNEEAQTEHIEVVNRKVYDQTKSKAHRDE